MSLQWSIEPSRSLATRLIVEAGSTPDAANLATASLAPDTTTLLVPSVLRGTYYVRARAVNGTGPGEPSNDIAVVVP